MMNEIFVWSYSSCLADLKAVPGVSLFDPTFPVLAVRMERNIIHRFLLITESLISGHYQGNATLLWLS